MLVLRYENILIREFNKNDIDNKIEWINNNENNKYLHYELPLSKEKTITWFENKEKNRLDCVIEYEDIPIGLIGLLHIDSFNSKAEFYISMGRTDFKRRGIGTKAVRLILKYAFEKLGLKKVYLNVDEENIGACRLYEKVGFNLEGRFIRDMFHNGIWINRCRYAIFYDDLRVNE